MTLAYAGTKRTVTDGPFTETKELIAGYWVIQVSSKEEAIDWASRAPFENGQAECARCSRRRTSPQMSFLLRRPRARTRSGADAPECSQIVTR